MLGAGVLALDELGVLAVDAGVERGAGGWSSARPRSATSRTSRCGCCARCGEADVIACEDTRHTRKLLDRHGIEARGCSAPTSTTSARARSELAERIERGDVVALVSDAGTPRSRTPGFALVRECLARGLAVEVLPGPSAVVTALVASGLPADAGGSPGSCRARPGELRAELERGDARRWSRSSRPAAAKTLRCSPSSTPSDRSRSAGS